MSGLHRLFVAAALALGAGAAVAQDRWEDLATGLSLAPPPGVPLEHTGRGDELLQVGTPGQAVTRLLIKDAGEAIDIDTVVKKANEQLLFVYPSAVAMKHRRLRVEGREAALVYFLIADGKRPAWVLGQGFVLADAERVAVLTLDADEPRFEAARPAFEAMFESIRFADAKAIEARRAAWVEQGRKWLATVTPQRIEATLVPERWFRVLEKDLDVGYLRVRQRRDTEMNLKGVRVDVQVRIVQGRDAVDTLSSFFLADTMTTEFWSIRSTLRPATEEDRPHAPAPAPPARTPPRPGAAPAAVDQGPPLMSWAETGLRSDHEITVSRQSPAGVRELRWDKDKMPAVWLPMALQYLVGALLPRDAEQTYGFYSYDPQRQKLTLRSLRVRPRADGGYDVLLRPTLGVPEQKSVYDRYGRLISQEVGEHRVLLPTTAQQVQTIWRLRE